MRFGVERMFKVDETIKFCLPMFRGGFNASQIKLGIGVERNALRDNLMLQFCMMLRLSSMQKFVETQTRGL